MRGSRRSPEPAGVVTGFGYTETQERSTGRFASFAVALLLGSLAARIPVTGYAVHSIDIELGKAER
jgi:hypothetical protein